jgi:hypothetical protein
VALAGLLALELKCDVLLLPSATDISVSIYRITKRNTALHLQRLALQDGLLRLSMQVVGLEYSHCDFSLWSSAFPLLAGLIPRV